MTRDEVLQFFLSKGFEQKRSKRILQKPGQHKVRLVLMERVLRYEVESNSLTNHWTMTRHAYYGELSINPETGKLRGLKPWHL